MDTGRIFHNQQAKSGPWSKSASADIGRSGLTSRIVELDGIRGVAILLVVNTHAGLIGSSTGGMVGVTLFFVLSGFLITRLLLLERESTGSISLRAFYGRRAIRLLPALAIYLIGMAIIAAWQRLDVPIFDMTWPPALYLANYVQIYGQDLYAHRHTWSLAVEEHFYLIWPVLVMLGAARKMRWLAIGTVALLAWRLILGMALGQPFWAYHGTDSNAYALALGCLLAVAHREGRLPRFPGRTAELALGLILVLSLIPIRVAEHIVPGFVWLPPIAACLGAVAIVGALQSGSTLFRSRWLVQLGMISYSLYLWHAPLVRLPGLSESVFRRGVAVVLAVLVAIGSWVLIEGPLMRSSWRRRLTSVKVAAEASRA